MLTDQGKRIADVIIGLSVITIVGLIGSTVYPSTSRPSRTETSSEPVQASVIARPMNEPSINVVQRNTAPTKIVDMEPLTPIPPVRQDDPNMMETMLEQMRVIDGDLTSRLNTLSDAAQSAACTPYTKYLVEQFRDRTAGARQVAPRQWMIFRRNAEGKTPFIFVSPADVRMFRLPIRSHFSFDGVGFKFLVQSDWSEGYLGALLLHEMTHWDDVVLSKREVMNGDTHSDSYLQGELRAYRVETDALNCLTDGVFGEVAAQVISDPSLSAPVPGTSITLPTPAGAELLHRAFPGMPATMHEQANRNATGLFGLIALQDENPKQQLAAMRRIHQ